MEVELHTLKMWTLLSSGFISDLSLRFSYHSIVFSGVVWVCFPLWAHSHGSEWNKANPSKRENTLFSPVLRASKVDFKWRFSWFTQKSFWLWVKSFPLLILNQYTRKFGKLSSGHRAEKGQFSFQFLKERQCQRMFKLPHNWTHLTR